MDDIDINNLVGIDLSELNKISSTLLAEIDTRDVDIGNVFYNIQPTKLVPFVSWNNISKIYRGFIPSVSDWVNISNKYISLKYLRNHPSQPEIYGDAGIEMNTQTNKNILYFHHDVNKLQYDESIIVTNLTEAIGFDIINTAEKDMISSFDVPDQEIHYYILKDLISNDSLFTNYLSVDESYQTKKSYLTLRFYPSDKEKSFTFTITQQSDNGLYLRVKIKGQHGKSVVEHFMSIMSKLLYLYNLKKQEITDIYLSYGVDINNDVVAEKISDKKLTGSSRRCPKQKQPTVHKTEISAMSVVNNNTERVMKLSTNGTDKYYTCSTNPDWIYPGLTTPHEDDLGIACCFKKKQVGDPTSQYSKYLKGDNTIKVTTTPHILSGNKAIGETQQADLPDTLKRLFNGKLPTHQHTFMRYGVDASPRSFILCIGKALTINEDVYQDTPFLAKQEMYDYSVNEIKSILTNQDTYIEPRMFLTLLGEIEKINIFMFGKSGILKPRYANGYYKKSNKYKSVIIYEQPGDKGSYSQWEIIALINGKDKQFLFDYDDPISVWLRGLLYIETKTKVNDRLLPMFSDLNLKPNWIIKGHMIDSYGKTRVIKVMSPTNEEFVFYTTPIQPLNYPVIIVDKIAVYTTEKQQRLSECINNKETERVNNITTMVNETGVEIRVPMEEIHIDASVTKSSIMGEESYMRVFIKQKRISRYIIEYTKWMFAKYGDAQNVDKFIRDKMKVINNFTYTGIPKNFSEQSGIVVDGKIASDSIKTMSQLKFILEMIVLRTPTMLNKYKSIVQIPGYYNTITDFNKTLAAQSGDERNIRDYNYNVFAGKNMINFIIKQK